MRGSWGHQGGRGRSAADSARRLRLPATLGPGQADEAEGGQAPRGPQGPQWLKGPQGFLGPLGPQESPGTEEAEEAEGAPQARPSAGATSPALQAEPAGCGWFESSRTLREGAEVREHEVLDPIVNDLPLARWIERAGLRPGMHPP